ncbi:hypothetical protein [Phytobacter massiliensis]|uniref:hypothetical protein n=1 Tax=Phytobacter massiliensis TaxID=1485952 RepID=UPI0002E4F872|nr:hypothetical protein [Phytobacter massiliensis]
MNNKGYGDEKMKMNDTEEAQARKMWVIITYATRVEDLLRKNGAKGAGFKELVESLSDVLESGIKRNIGRMAHLRNMVVHEGHVCSEREMAGYEAQFKSVTQALIAMLDARQQNAELVENLKVSMKAKSGLKRLLIGSLIGGLVIAGVLIRVTQ